jgi:hypothetical protein
MVVCQPSYPFLVQSTAAQPPPAQQQQRAIFHPYRHPSIRPKPQATDGFINCTHLYAAQAQKMPVARQQLPSAAADAFVQLHRPMVVPNLRALAPMPPPRPPAVLGEPDSVLKLFSEAADIHERQQHLEAEKARGTDGPRRVLPKGPEK